MFQPWYGVGLSDGSDTDIGVRASVCSACTADAAVTGSTAAAVATTAAEDRPHRSYEIHANS